MQTNLRIFPSKLRNIRLEPFGVEPVKHLVEFFTQEQSHDRHRKLLEFDRSVENATEDFCRFDIRKFASRDLQFHTHEFLRTLKCQRYKAADVIGGNGLIWLVASNGIGQFSL